jgi:tetratricopeptide (TPR) repeat protein
VRREAQVPNREIAVCAQCHSRRSQFSENYVAGAPLLDHYLPELLLPDLYYADGQQKDEVFSFGSFLQSKMYHAGVTCSHCHDPHSGLLRVPGNQVCGQCHASSTYDTEQHHFHAPASSGARCVSCHMPPTTYMVIDPRRDHSFRVPQPHLSVDLGVPNPCTGCHVDRPPEWAAEHVKTWYGRNPTGFQRFAYAFHADEHGHAGATAALTKIVEDVSHPATARASALQRLARRPRAALQEVARTGLGDRDPQVRRAALSLVENLPSEDRVRFAAVALNDPVRAVRVQAAWILAPTWRQLHPPAQFAFQRAAEEFVASQRYLADRPEGRSTLGTFFVYLGRFAEAEAEYRAAMLLLPSFVPAYINLADMFRSQQREAEAERILRDGLAAAPGTGVLHYSLGLTLARLRRTPEALQELERASVLTPEDARVVYTYAVALHSTGNAREAITTLEAALPRHPESREMLFALATFHRDLGNSVAASRYSERLLEVYPDDVQAQMLRRSLRPQ